MNKDLMLTIGLLLASAYFAVGGIYMDAGYKPRTDAGDHADKRIGIKRTECFIVSRQLIGLNGLGFC